MSPRHDEDDDGYTLKTDEEFKSDTSSNSEYHQLKAIEEETRMDMDAWVRYHNGNRPIKKLLIANNGIAAVKCIKYVRQWCYETFGDMNAIHFVCMATPEDIKSNAEYIRMADEVVPVPGGSNNYNYANVTIIVTIATQTKCDAVWPGWGHASEYPSLPRELARKDIGWIGPDADAMYASGDKIMSTLIAQYAKVPTVPWSGDGIRVKYKRGDMTEVEIGFKKSCITNLEEAINCAKKIGYPVMIKASEGGGGKGIRKCENEEEMKSAYNQVVNEVPGSPIFIMKLASNARHLEVQLLGDTWGNVIALFGRDCSMQRRHQKIIEEGPVINVDEKLLLEMEASAVALAKSVHYVGAGTVEFLYDNETKSYFFLELNPRLQVEHPVTELISGINLPACQVMVAMGIPLYCIKDIRKLYSQKDLNGTNQFELSNENRIKPIKHAIACRITAENPLNNFTPTSGLISELHFRSLPNVWGYFSLKTKSSIHDYADSQFGHIFASGETRDEARKSMILALSQLEIRGEIRTTIEFLSSILENKEYKMGKFHTTWLEKQMNKSNIVRVPSHLTPEKIVLLGGVANGHKLLTETNEKLMADLLHGRNIHKGKYTDNLVKCPVELIYKNVKYRIFIEKTSDLSYTLRYENNWKVDVIVRPLSDNGLLVSLDGRSHVLYAEWNSAEQLVLCCDGHTVEFEQEYDPSNIRAVMPGKLVKILISSGQHVNKGDPFAEIEVMKMYMPLIVPEAGIIDIIAQPGSILQIGQLIATLKLDDPSQVKKANKYDKSFPKMMEPEKSSVRVDRKFIQAKTRVESMLDGFIAFTDIDKDYVRENVDLMMNALRDPALPLDEFNSALEPLHGRIDENLYKKFKEKVNIYSDKLQTYRFRWEKPETFPSEVILGHIDAFKQRLQPSEIGTFEAIIDPIKQVCNKHKRGTHHYAVQVISDLLETFSIRESRFVDKDENVVIQQLRREAPNNLQNVATIVQSHFQLKHREKVIMELLNIVDSIFHNRMYEFISELTHILEVMTYLTDIKYGKIHLKSREILASIDVSSESQRKMEIENMLKSHPSLLQRSSYLGIPKQATSLSQRSSSSGDFSMSKSPSSIKAQTSGDLNVNRRRNKTDLFNDDGLLHAIPDLLEILPKYMLSENQNVACNAVELWIRSVFAPPFYFVDKRSMTVKWLIDESTQCSFSFTTVNPKDIRKDKSKKHHQESAMHPKKNKQGFFGFFANLHSLKDNFKNIIDQFPPKESLPVHAIILGFSDKNVEKFNEREFTISMEKFFAPYRQQLVSCGISFISVFVPSESSSAPHLFTFRYMLDFREDPMTRHIMPPLVTMLEMDRLKMGFQIQWMPTENRRIHVFEAKPMRKKLFTRNWDGKRLFARVPVAQMVKPTTMVEDIITDYYRFGGPEFALMEATHVLESIISGDGNNSNKYRYNHILLACFFDVDFSGNDSDFTQQFDFDDVEQVKKWKKRVFNYIYGRINHDYQLFAKQLKRLHVTHIEIRFQIRMQHKTRDFPPYIFRAFLDEPGNGIINIHLYLEKTSSEDGSVKLIDPGYGKTLGRLHNTDAFAEHIVEHNLMAQRITAKNLQTTYVYDWPLLFEKALQAIWYDYKSKQKGITQTATFNIGTHSARIPSIDLMANNEETKQQQSTDEHSDLPFEDNLIQFEEYILDNKNNNKLIKVERAPGQNKVAMVVWKVTMKTPQFPSGRSIIIASNDIANNLGTFSLEEDRLYNEACNWAQREGLPFIYLSANSGARIGLSQELMNKFKIAWAHEHHEEKENTAKRTKEAEWEPQYLYLDEETYAELPKDEINKVVNVEKLEVGGKTRYRICDIIGKYGIGVENLSGSGLIAGATSRAQFNTFTLSYVTGRSVGIGAYLVRLGQRIIQKTDSPILLTGYVALNNLLGKSVYISNQQIGGANDIMMPNGVSHYQVDDDLEGAYQILKWLSYIPSKQGKPYPIEHNLLSLHDPIDRDVMYYPESDKYDPRCLIAGDEKPIIVDKTTSSKKPRKSKQEMKIDQDIDDNDVDDEDDEIKDGDSNETSLVGVDKYGDSIVYNEWLSGLFDRDSWTEYLNTWATSVVIGRARLGGIPCGIIATETRATTHVIPPDPALEDESTEISFNQPGQVWYPDSSFKTSQAIRDFKCEELPLFILANWRGFSGGQRDMFHEILKYGSYIVDELADYKQPVFIYLPPTAELRGGAWVVLDSLINDRVIEMYSAEKSKANVLEPTATVGLKYRKKALLKTMHRIDPQLIGLDEKLKKIEKLSPNDKNTINDIRKEIENRERGLFPIYNKIALMYAQLHDTPQRMKDVGVVKNVVQWRNSRRYFYWRLRRKLITNTAINNIVKDMSLNQIDWKIAENKFDEWVLKQYNDDDDNEHDDDEMKANKTNDEIIYDDKTFVEWYETQKKSFNQFRINLQQQSIENKLQSLVNKFNGDKKQLQEIFQKLMQNKSSQSAEDQFDDQIVNID